MIAVRDIAWAAGFLEGEGHFLKCMGITASQVQREPLEKLQVLFGGNIKIRSAKEGVRQAHYVWSVHGSKGAGVIMTLWTLMSTLRRRQIGENLAVWRTKRPRIRQNVAYCSKGHPRSVHGVRKDGFCLLCNREEKRKWIREKRLRIRLSKPPVNLWSI